MTLKLPNPSWQQPNNSDKFGNMWYTRNMYFDEQGYMKLSPRMVRLISSESAVGTGDADFNLPLAIGKQARGDFQVATTDANWGVTVNNTTIDADEDVGASNPAPSFEGHGAWFAGLWHVSTDTAVLSRPATGDASQAYTSRITGLTSGKRHIIDVFQSRVEIVVTNGNVLKQYDTNYSGTTDLTIPSDFEMSGVAYNNGKMGIITRLSNDGTVGQDQNAKFFIWKGSTTGDNGSWDLGSDAGVAVFAYKSSFGVITRTGEVLYFNGGGFQRLGAFPFHFTDDIWGNEQDNNALGQIHVTVDGDFIYINIGNELAEYDVKQEEYRENIPAGTWCYDPRVGLYHRYSLSNSPAYINNVTQANVNTTTNVLTLASGTIPATGNVARMINGAIGGLTQNKNYYIIYLTATTFKLATSRELAFVGSAVDITSTGSSNNYFLMVDQRDYGQSQYNTAGAIALHNYRNNTYTDIVAGADIQDTDLTALQVFCTAVPQLENRGVMVSPRIFSQEKEDSLNGITVRFKPLNSDSSILVYARSKEYYNIPTSTTNDGATFTGRKDLYTAHDISEAKTIVDADGEHDIYMHIIAGTGAGEIVKVTAINEEDGTYSICLDNEIWGVTAGDKCEFQLLNYQLIGTITSDDNDKGSETFGQNLPASKFYQYMIESRGYDIIIEEILYNNSISNK